MSKVRHADVLGLTTREQHALTTACERAVRGQTVYVGHDGEEVGMAAKKRRKRRGGY